MKVSVVLVLSSLLVVVPPRVAVAQLANRIRPLDAASVEALQRGLSQSSVFRTLVAEIESSNVIVHVLASVSLPAGARGITRLTSVGSQQRYVRIVIDAELAPADRTAILGHELQHACEIARSRASDARSMRALYRLIGQAASPARDAYETYAAIKAGSQVRSELRHAGRRPSKTHP